MGSESANRKAFPTLYTIKLMCRLDTPTLHLVRHAEGYHNLAAQNAGIHDPLLTETGEEQARSLQTLFPHHDSIDLLCASPIKRTIQTGLLGFKPCIDRGLTLLALPRAQESSNDPCDTGSTVDELKSFFKDSPVDLSRVEQWPYWNSKHGIWAPECKALDERARKLRRWLREQTLHNSAMQHIVVVSHGDFLHHVTEDINEAGEQVGGDWKNVEFRSYRYKDEGDENAMIVETEESVRRRKARIVPTYGSDVALEAKVEVDEAVENAKR